MSIIESTWMAGTAVAFRDGISAVVGNLPACVVLFLIWAAVQHGVNTLKRPLGLYKDMPDVSSTRRFVAGSPFFLVVGFLVGLIVASVKGGIAWSWSLTVADLMSVLVLALMLLPALFSKGRDEPVGRTVMRASLNIFAGLFAYAAALALGDVVGYGVGSAVSAVVTAIGVAVTFVTNLLSAVFQIGVFLLLGFMFFSGAGARRGGRGEDAWRPTESREEKLRPGDRGEFGHDEYGVPFQSWISRQQWEDRQERQN